MMFIREFRIAGNTLPHLRSSLDLRAILAVHEVDPRKNTDKAKCYIETDISQEPLFLADGYEEVRDAWLNALRVAMGEDDKEDDIPHSPRLRVAEGEA